METNIATDKLQSQRLLRCGVSADKASYNSYVTSVGSVVRTPSPPIFTLADLSPMLPNGIIHNGLSCKLSIRWSDGPYFAGYMNQEDKYIMGNPYDAPFSAEELIDAIFELLCWAIDHNHVKLD